MLRVTARTLGEARIAHPATYLQLPGEEVMDVSLPVVVKPRFGSWGRDVVLCRNRAELTRTLDRFADKTWFRSHGALVQEPIPPSGHDLRVLVAGGTVVGAVERHAAPGEWRTNVALGGTRPLALLTLIAAALGVTAPAVAKAPLRDCGELRSTSYAIAAITAVNVTCAEARRVARAAPARCSPAGQLRPSCTVRGFNCLVARAGKELFFARCSKSRPGVELFRVVRFEYGS